MTIRLISPKTVSGGFALGVFLHQPSHDSRLTIKYRLQYKVAGQDQWSSLMRTKSQNLVIPNLSHSTTYQVRVRGVSVAGRYGLFGEWSEEASTAGLVLFHYIVHRTLL